MDLARSAEFQLRLQHRHNDGSWSELEPTEVIHDPAERDPEQRWGSSKLYVCKACDEQVLVDATDEPLKPIE